MIKRKSGRYPWKQKPVCKNCGERMKHFGENCENCGCSEYIDKWVDTSEEKKDTGVTEYFETFVCEECDNVFSANPKRGFMRCPVCDSGYVVKWEDEND